MVCKDIKEKYCEIIFNSIWEIFKNNMFQLYLKSHDFPKLDDLKEDERIASTSQSLDKYIVNKNKNVLEQIQTIIRLFYIEHKNRPFILFTSVLTSLFEPFADFYEKNNKVDWVDVLRTKTYEEWKK